MKQIINQDNKKVEIEITQREIVCKKCFSNNLVFNGTKRGIQYFKCKDCGSNQSANVGFSGDRYDKKLVIEAFNNYYRGMSFKDIVDSFKNKKVEITKTTIWSWLIKYTNLIIPFTENILKPKVAGDEWYVDETVINIHSKNMWLWLVLDYETRMILASILTDTRPIKAAVKLFEEAKDFSGVIPKTIVSDKMTSYPQAIKQVFGNKTNHLASKGFTSNVNTNVSERLNEYFKERTKILRSFKREETAKIILKGLVIFYNYFWEHSSLGYKTPSEIAKINLGKIKQIGDLIQHGISYKKKRILPN